MTADDLNVPTTEPEPDQPANGRVSAVIQPPEGYVAVETYIVYAHKSVIEDAPVASTGRAFEVPDFVAGLNNIVKKLYPDSVVVTTTESLTRKKPREHIATVVWIDTPETAKARVKATKPKSGTLEAKHVPKLMTELARLKLADDVIKEAQEREVKVAVVAREKLLAKHGITAEELQQLIDDFNND